MREVCFHCHANEGTAAQRLTGKKVPLINPDEYDSTSHADVTCTICHSEATGPKHGMQMPGECGQCHLPHDEKVAHDLHALVSCEACHLRDIQPFRASQSKRILWKSEAKAGQISEIHDMLGTYNDDGCQRCHTVGNQIGAAAMILPPKSILCMPCHAATFSIGDITTFLSLVVFAAGLTSVAFYFLSGSVTGLVNAGPIRKLLTMLWSAARTVFSTKIRFIIKALFLDVLLQRRLYRQSAGRWFIHSLIFVPFIFRFSWGIVALIGSLWLPEWTPTWAMLNKNDPITAFLFDFTGVMVILGVLLAFFRVYLFRNEAAKRLPKQDHLALCLISGIVIFGFVLEGMRIAMTSAPSGASYAFIGYGISRLFSNPSVLSEAYGYVWYIHAILTGAMVAYIPFSRLLHIIIAPVVLSMNEVIAHGHKKEA
jgi:nitrate reductase gamma subunit